MSRTHEVITLSPDADPNFYLCEFAVNGQRVQPFYVLKSHRRLFSTEQAWMAYLCRQADTMLEESANVEAA